MIPRLVTNHLSIPKYAAHGSSVEAPSSLTGLKATRSHNQIFISQLVLLDRISIKTANHLRPIF